jgi:Sterol-sensing domain of SREBP cleavage-activation
LQVIPFLVLAVGVDNIFILVQNVQREPIPKNCKDPAALMVARALGHVGPSMLLTSVSEITCFFLGKNRWHLQSKRAANDLNPTAPRAESGSSGKKPPISMPELAVKPSLFSLLFRPFGFGIDSCVCVCARVRAVLLQQAINESLELQARSLKCLP